MTNNVYETPESDVAVNSGGTASLSTKEILFSFKGRIPRKTYWLTSLALMVAIFVIIILATVIGAGESALGFLLLVIYIPAIWISLAVQVKRWHDRDKSGWWVLIAFVPVIGPFWALIENGFLAGTPEENRFGLPSA